MMERLIKLTILLIIVFGIVPFTWAEKLPEKPNFVFILADAMGWTGASVQIDPEVPESKSDYYQTPNLEKLAQQGIRFTQAYAPGSMCIPTRAAVLTGKTPAGKDATIIFITPGVAAPTYTSRLANARTMICLNLVTKYVKAELTQTI